MRSARFFTICLAALAALAIVPAWASAAPASFVDGDFAGGTTDANAIAFAPGFVVLRPFVITDTFDGGPGLPSTWEPRPEPWTPSGSAQVANGALRVDGTYARTRATYTLGRLSFVATFGASQNQHVGLGQDFNDPPWAMFSTGTSSLDPGFYARTSVLGQTPTNTAIPVDPTVPHTYTIEWTTNQVRFSVDGRLVAIHAVTLPPDQHIVASDFTADGVPIIVDSVSFEPSPPIYAASGVFTSRVFDASPRVDGWGTASAAGNVNGVAIQTRSSADGGSWSGWQGLGAGGAIQSPVARYLQYRLILSPVGGATPVVDSVTLGYDVDNAAPRVGIQGLSVVRSTAKVTFSSPDGDVARFECSLDSGAYVACANPKTYTGLRAGKHVIAVRAVDRVGNTGLPVVRPFSVELTRPNVGLSPRTARASKSGRVTFRVKCPRTEVLCSVRVQLKRGSKVVASTRVGAAGGKTVKATLRLDKSTRSYLSKHARLRLTAVTAARDAAGNRRTKRTKVTVLAPKR